MYMSTLNPINFGIIRNVAYATYFILVPFEREVDMSVLMRV